jgi:hypothetical protein
MIDTTTPTPTLDPIAVEELRTRRAGGETLAELKKEFPNLSGDQIREALEVPADAPKLDLPKLDAIITGEKPKRQKKAPAPVASSRVAPVEPDYSKLPESKREAARKRYERAVAQFTGGVSEVPTVEAKPKKSTPKKETGSKKAPAKKAEPIEPPAGFKSWTDPKLATAVVRKKTKEGKTIKTIAEELGLPAVHRSWFLVSKVWRETADAKGLERARLSPEAIEARKAKREAK